MSVTTRDDALDMLRLIYLEVKSPVREKITKLYAELIDTIGAYVPESHPDVDSKFVDNLYDVPSEDG